MIYVIDTDSLIALRRTYAPKYFAPLWAKIEAAIEKSVIISTRINFEELKIEEDDEFFLEWKTAHENMFLEITEKVQLIVSDIMENFPDLIDIQNDQEQADPYIVAMAVNKKGTVITEEEPLSKQALLDPKRKAKMKIPNVCQHYGVPVRKLIEFINSDDWRF